MATWQDQFLNSGQYRTVPNDIPSLRACKTVDLTSDPRLATRDGKEVRQVNIEHRLTQYSHGSG